MEFEHYTSFSDRQRSFEDKPFHNVPLIADNPTASPLREGLADGSLSDEDKHIDITLKLHLLPTIVQLLQFDNISTLKKAQHQAFEVLGNVRSKVPGDVSLQARCYYYIGVAYYLLSLHNSSPQAAAMRQSSMRSFTRALETKNRYPEGKWAGQWIDFCNAEEAGMGFPSATAGSIAVRGLSISQRLSAWLKNVEGGPQLSTEVNGQNVLKEERERVPSFSTWSSSHRSHVAQTRRPSLSVKSRHESSLQGSSSETSGTSVSSHSQHQKNGIIGNSHPGLSVSIGNEPVPMPLFFTPSWSPLRNGANRHNGEMASSPTTYSKDGHTPGDRIADQPQASDASSGSGPSCKWHASGLAIHDPPGSHRKGTMDYATDPEDGESGPVADRPMAILARPTGDVEGKPSRTLYDRRRRKSSWAQTLGLTKPRLEDELALAEAGKSPKFIDHPDPLALSPLNGREQINAQGKGGSPGEVLK